MKIYIDEVTIEGTVDEIVDLINKYKNNKKGNNKYDFYPNYEDMIKNIESLKKWIKFQ